MTKQKQPRLCRGCQAPLGSIRYTEYCTNCAHLRPCTECGGPRDCPNASRPGGLSAICRACGWKANPVKRCARCGQPVSNRAGNSDYCTACAAYRPCSNCGGPRDQRKAEGGYRARCVACERKRQREKYWKIAGRRAAEQRRRRATRKKEKRLSK